MLINLEINVIFIKLYVIIYILVQMLNHKIESPCFITRESIKLDMIKRGVQCIEAMHSGNNNFLGY